MPDYDAGFKIVAREAGRDLAMLGDVVCDEWAPITGEVHATERLADRAFRAKRDGEEFIVYMEAYSRWESKAPWSILAKSGLLSERERLPCVTMMFVLQQLGYHDMHGTFQLKVKAFGRVTQQIWFREICLGQTFFDKKWESSPGLMALTPLCRNRFPLEQTVAHAARCIKQRATDRIREADLLTVLGLFGKLADRKFDPFHVIGREAMKESKFYQEIMEEGEINADRKAVLRALEVRFGKGSSEKFKEALQSIYGADELDELNRAAIKCRTLDAFRRVLARTLKSEPTSK